MPTALLIVDHGSRRNEANALLEEVAELLRATRPGLLVEAAHMELAEPTIAEGFRSCVERGADEVIVHPYMLSPGRHASTDIPELVREVAREFPDVRHRVTPPLGLHEKICAVILERAGLDSDA